MCGIDAMKYLESYIREHSVAIVMSPRKSFIDTTRNSTREYQDTRLAYVTRYFGAEPGPTLCANTAADSTFWQAD